MMKQAMNELYSAKSGLSSCVDKAKKTIQGLEAKKVKLKQAIKSTAARYDKVQNFTAAICDDCWEVLPALGNLTIPQTRLQSCIGCGNALGSSVEDLFSPDEQDLPPDFSQSITNAQEAEGYADDVIKGNITDEDDSNYGCTKRSYVSSYDGKWASRDLYEHRRERGYSQYHGYAGQNSKIESKSTLLDEVETQKKKLEEEVKSVTYKISKWEIYGEEHKTKLKEITAKHNSFQDRHRKVLEDELRQLNGGTSALTKAKSSTANCCVCMDRPKDTVFQCGHQCCSVCSISMSNCHSCRARITERIKLFE